MSESDGKAEEANNVATASGDTSEGTGLPAEQIKQMRAVVLTSHGGLKGLKVMNRPEPTVADGEVAIRVKCW